MCCNAGTRAADEEETLQLKLLEGSFVLVHHEQQEHFQQVKRVYADDNMQPMLVTQVHIQCPSGVRTV